MFRLPRNFSRGAADKLRRRFSSHSNICTGRFIGSNYADGLCKSLLVAGGLIVGLVGSRQVVAESSESVDNADPTVLKKKYAAIIVGGGTGGCTLAYFLAKWMQEKNVPGEVLLLERGAEYFDPEKSPTPRIAKWHDIWGSYGQAHETVYADGDPTGNGHYPVMPTDHRGLGGCSTHDTRIQFQYSERHKLKIAEEMNINVDDLNMYYQAIMNVIPLSPAIPVGQKIQFYDDVLNYLDKDSVFKRLPGDEHKTELRMNSVGMSTVAMYANKDCLRWTSAMLLHDSVRPSNLKILTEVTVDKIEFDKNLHATGVSIEVGVQNEKYQLQLEKNGEVILMSGAMGNPAVMQRSGLGPKEVLEKAGIEVLVDNPSIGHGCDHEEIGMIYEWLDKYNDENGNIPQVSMGWPFIILGDFRMDLKNLFDKGGNSPGSTFGTGFLAHFGAGYCDPYTEIPAIALTPSCVVPDMSDTGGFRVHITGKSPHLSTKVIQGITL